MKRELVFVFKPQNITKVSIEGRCLGVAFWTHHVAHSCLPSLGDLQCIALKSLIVKKKKKFPVL